MGLNILWVQFEEDDSVLISFGLDIRMSADFILLRLGILECWARRSVVCELRHLVSYAIDWHLILGWTRPKVVCGFEGDQVVCEVRSLTCS